MSKDWIDQEDVAFRALGRKMIAGATGHETNLGLTPALLTMLSDALEDCDAASLAVSNAETAYTNAIVARKAARSVAEPQMRAINKTVQAKAGVAAELKSGMGLPLYDGTSSPASKPTTRPLLVVDNSQRLQHTLTFRDEATPKSRAKPAGVREIEIYCKIGAPAPADAGDCVLMATSAKNDAVITHKGADASKAAYYMARWKSTRDECGPWSETVLATIGA